MTSRAARSVAAPRRHAASLHSQYAQFACPHEGFDEDFGAALAAEHVRVLVERFVQQHGTIVAARSRGLCEYLEASGEQTHDFDSVWDCSFGTMHAALSSGSAADLLQSAVMVGLQLCVSGAGQWEATLGRSVRLRVGGYLLPACDRIAVRSTGADLIVETGTRRRRTSIVFHRQAATWVSHEAESLPRCEVPGRQLMLLPPRALQPYDGQWMLSLLERRRPGVGITSVETAGRLLADFAPEYLTWVSRVIRHVVPWRHAPMMQSSGSMADSPGLVGLSVGHGAPETAQMLAHEATHQYMYLLRRLGPLDDGSDRELYYSPVRGTDRPIGAIVVAYHAAGNEVLFFRTCRRNGLWNAYFEQMEGNRLAQLQVMEGALAESRAITPLGHALWQPVYRSIYDRPVGQVRSGRR